MTLPVIPRASTLTTPQQVAEVAAALVAWADTVDDIAQVKDASAKWAAICEYVRRTSREGVAEAEGALRRLEMRVGELLGEAKTGRPNLPREVDIADNRVHEFRQMAAHPEIVEQVIAESTDTDPPSRAKVLREINSHKLNEGIREDVAWANEIAERSGHDPVEAGRRERIFTIVMHAAKAMNALNEISRDDVLWAIQSTPPKLRHLAEIAGNELTDIVLIASSFDDGSPWIERLPA